MASPETCWGATSWGMTPLVPLGLYSGGVAIGYVLPVLWMTSCLYTMARRNGRPHSERKRTSLAVVSNDGASVRCLRTAHRSLIASTRCTRQRSIATSVSVCLSVCLSACISQKWDVQPSPNLQRMLPPAVTDSDALRYVLPILSMTS